MSCLHHLTWLWWISDVQGEECGCVVEALPKPQQCEMEAHSTKSSAKHKEHPAQKVTAPQGARQAARPSLPPSPSNL